MMLIFIYKTIYVTWLLMVFSISHHLLRLVCDVLLHGFYNEAMADSVQFKSKDS